MELYMDTHLADRGILKTFPYLALLEAGVNFVQKRAGKVETCVILDAEVEADNEWVVLALTTDKGRKVALDVTKECIDNAIIVNPIYGV
ncbi:MAG: hypothetical protein BWY95_01120 [Bacteroidetes bacterium ADurb.BinA104]|nr:MAG: hypothetical protein BWY95_01120 [Bacteroidetes bacterium ADurb.BinA104]